MSKTKTRKIEAVHKLTGYKHTFEYKEISDFDNTEQYINYALDMYLKNPWVFFQYRYEIKSKDESEITNEDLIAFAILDAYQEHSSRVFVPEFVRRDHQVMNSGITKVLKGIIKGNKG